MFARSRNRRVPAVTTAVEVDAQPAGGRELKHEIGAPECGSKSVADTLLASLVAGIGFCQSEGQARLVHGFLHALELGFQLWIWPEESFDRHRRIGVRSLCIIVLREE